MRRKRSLTGVERDRATLKALKAKPGRKGRWLSYSMRKDEAVGFTERNRGPHSVYKLHFPSFPISSLHCHFLSNRCLRCSARRDRAQLGPCCVHVPSSAASPRPGPAVGPGPNHSPAPCRSVPRRLRLGCWQRDNLPCQQKKPECATEKLSGVKTYKNKRNGGNQQRPKTERRDGESTRTTKDAFFSAVSWLLMSGISGVCSQKIPTAAVRRKALTPNWEAAGRNRPLLQAERHRQNRRTEDIRFRYDISS